MTRGGKRYSVLPYLRVRADNLMMHEGNALNALDKGASNMEKEFT